MDSISPVASLAAGKPANRGIGIRMPPRVISPITGSSGAVLKRAGNHCSTNGVHKYDGVHSASRCRTVLCASCPLRSPQAPFAYKLRARCSLLTRSAGFQAVLPPLPEPVRLADHGDPLLYANIHRSSLRKRHVRTFQKHVDAERPRSHRAKFSDSLSMGTSTPRSSHNRVRSIDPPSTE